MDPQHEPIDDSEAVYRRIHRNHYQAALAIPVQRAAFRPNANDTTGLSIFRERFVKPEETLGNVDPARRNDYYVARLAVRDLRQLNLSVIPEPNPSGPPGHAVIPELSWSAYQANRQSLALIQIELTKLASAAIVHAAS